MCRGANWKVAIYGKDHGIPHFHIEGVEFRCSIGIASLEMIIGGAPPAVLTEALSWAATNQAALWRQWQELNG